MGEKREKESGSDGSDSKENREAQSNSITGLSNEQEAEDGEETHSSAPRRRGGETVHHRHVNGHFILILQFPIGLKDIVHPKM